jgi:hypothetical protein
MSRASGIARLTMIGFRRFPPLPVAIAWGAHRKWTRRRKRAPPPPPLARRFPGTPHQHPLPQRPSSLPAPPQPLHSRHAALPPRQLKPAHDTHRLTPPSDVCEMATANVLRLIVSTSVAPSTMPSGLSTAMLVGGCKVSGACSSCAADSSAATSFSTGALSACVYRIQPPRSAGSTPSS